MRLSILLALLVPPTLFANSYEVKEGEHLGRILHGQGYSPLWGEKGFVRKTMKLNPAIIKDEGNFIVRKSRIVLPVQASPKVPGNSPFHQTVELKDAAPQVIHRKQEHLSAAASFSTRAMVLEMKDKTDGAKETLKNDPAAGFSASVDHLFVDNWTAGVFLASHRLDFHKPGGEHLERGSRSFNEFGLSGARYFSDTTSLRATFSLDERPVLFEKGADLALERVTLPKATVTYSTELFEHKRLLLLGHLGAGALLPIWQDDYYVNPGYTVFTGLAARYALSRDWNMNAGLGAEHARQDNSRSENRYSELSAQIGVGRVFDSPNL